MGQTLISLAIVRANWETEKKDYIENFIPLFGSLLLSKKYKTIKLEHLQQIKNDFENIYGLVIPFNPIRQILNRLTKKGYLDKERNQLIPNFSKLEKLSINNEASSISKEFEFVINEIIDHAKTNHEIDFSIEEIENGLINFLKKNDLAILFATENESFLPNVNSKIQLDFVIGEFITNAYDKNQKAFNFILDLTVGYALTGTILYSEFNSFSGKLKNVNIYFDTAFVFSLLGIDGKTKKLLAEDLVRILNKEGANLFLLQTNQGELDSNLSECMRIMEQGNTDPIRSGNMTFRKCHENQISYSDIQELIVLLPDTLNKYKIKKEVVPDFEEFKRYQIDEDKLYDTIVDTYSSNKAKVASEISKNDNGLKEKFEKKERQNNTILRDVKVLSGIYRFREGIKPATLKDSIAIFITTNNSLAYASRIFELKEYNSKYTIPVCITDVFLGTLLWLQSPAEITNLRSRKLLVDCYAAMKPSEKLLKKYRYEIDKLRSQDEISEDKYYLLRTHQSAYSILESKTLGDPDSLDSDKTNEIIEEFIEMLKAEAADDLRNEKNEHIKTKSELDDEKEKHGQTKIILERVKKSEIQKELNQKCELIKELRRSYNKLYNSKNSLDSTSDKQGWFKIKFYIGLLIVEFIALVVLTFLFGWEIMEPITYFIGFISLIIGYIYFFLTENELKPKAILESSIFKARIKNYNKFDFDLEYYEELNLKIKDIGKDINRLEKSISETN